MDVEEESTIGKRPRGRPTGSGLDDMAELAAVADKIVASESGARQISPTAAMKQCVKGIEASHLRRLQVKWKVQGECLMAEARGRVRMRRAASEHAATAASVRGGIGQASAIAAMMQTFGPRYAALGAMGRFDPALMGKMLAGCPAEDATRAAAYAKAVAGISGLADAATLSASVRAAGMAFSPTLVSEYARFAGSLPVVTALQTLMEMAENPMSRWMREHQEAMDRADPLRLRRD